MKTPLSITLFVGDLSLIKKMECFKGGDICQPFIFPELSLIELIKFKSLTFVDAPLLESKLVVFVSSDKATTYNPVGLVKQDYTAVDNQYVEVRGVGSRRKHFDALGRCFIYIGMEIFKYPEGVSY